MKEEAKDQAEFQQKILARKKEIKAVLDKADSGRRKPNVLVIILIMTTVWGLYWLDSYPKYHPSRWFLIILSLVLAVGFSCYLLYCWKTRKFYNGVAPMRGEWIYRDEDPFFYWAYMALFLFWDAVIIYGLISPSLK